MVSQGSSDAKFLGIENVFHLLRVAVSLALDKGGIKPIYNLHSMFEMASLLLAFSLYHISLRIKVRGMYFEGICFRRGRIWMILWGHVVANFK